MYWPACDVITGSRVWVIKVVANTLPPGPISSTVGCTARNGMSVTVHCTECVSPAVTVEYILERSSLQDLGQLEGDTVITFTE